MDMRQDLSRACASVRLRPHARNLLVKHVCRAEPSPNFDPTIRYASCPAYLAPTPRAPIQLNVQSLNGVARARLAQTTEEMQVEKELFEAGEQVFEVCPSTTSRLSSAALASAVTARRRRDQLRQWATAQPPLVERRDDVRRNRASRWSSGSSTALQNLRQQ